MTSFVVVKVKYGDTLRRFNVVVNEDQQLDLDIGGLRTVIRSLFNFTVSDDLKLTYVDEDLDIVALVDEEDLQDVVSQGLNPVRITVQLNSRKEGSSSARQTVTSTATHPQDHNSSSKINNDVADLLKPVPEPLRENHSKLYVEADSKAAEFSPVLADLIDRIANICLSNLNAHHNPQFSPADVAAKEASERDNAPCRDKDASDSVDGKIKHYGVAPTSNCETMQCRLQSDCDMKNINDDCKRNLEGSFNTSSVAACKEGGSSGKGTAASTLPKVKGTFFQPVEEKNMKDPNDCEFGGPPMQSPMSSPLLLGRNFGPTDGLGIHIGICCDACRALPIYGPRFTSLVKGDYDLCYNCFARVGNAAAADYIRMDFPAPYRHTWSYNSNQLVASTINSQPWRRPLPPFPYPGKHMKPSQPILDSCFIMDVSVTDGTVMAAKTSFTKIWRMCNNGNVPWTRGTLLVWIGGDKFSCTDSVDIEVPVAGLHPEDEIDIAVDFVAPESPGQYISCWNLESPSGQKFGPCVSVLIQVAASLTDVACAASNNLNLNLPPEDAVANITQALNVEVGSEPSPGASSAKLEKPTVVNVGSEPSPVASSTKMEKPTVDEKGNDLEDLNLPNDLLCTPFLLASACSSSVSPQPTTTISEPVPAQSTCSSDSDPTIEADLVDTEPDPAPVSCAVTVPFPIIDAPLESAGAIVSQVDVLMESEVVNNDVDEALLKELEHMGFNQVNLNKDILKKNNHNLEKSLYDLCGFCEWDLLLEEMKAVVY